MGVWLSHLDMTPIFYGMILAVWFMIIVYHVFSAKLMAVVIDIAVFFIVISLHGGTMTGGMAATVCGVIVSLLAPPMVRAMFIRRSVKRRQT